MGRKQRHVQAVVSRYGLGAFPRFGILFCLLIFATQLAIPVAQIRHIAAEHVPAVASHHHRQSDPPETLRVQFESHRDHELDEMHCPSCQAFVYMQEVVDVPTQVATDVERSIYHRPLTPFTVGESFCYASAPRAPPLFS